MRTLATIRALLKAATPVACLFGLSGCFVPEGGWTLRSGLDWRTHAKPGVYVEMVDTRWDEWNRVAVMNSMSSLPNGCEFDSHYGAPPIGARPVSGPTALPTPVETHIGPRGNPPPVPPVTDLPRGRPTGDVEAPLGPSASRSSSKGIFGTWKRGQATTVSRSNTKVATSATTPSAPNRERPQTLPTASAATVSVTKPSRIDTGDDTPASPSGLENGTGAAGDSAVTGPGLSGFGAPRTRLETPFAGNGLRPAEPAVPLTAPGGLQLPITGEDAELFPGTSADGVRRSGPATGPNGEPLPSLATPATGPGTPASVPPSLGTGSAIPPTGSPSTPELPVLDPATPSTSTRRTPTGWGYSNGGVAPASWRYGVPGSVTPISGGAVILDPASSSAPARTTGAPVRPTSFGPSTTPTRSASAPGSTNRATEADPFRVLTGSPSAPGTEPGPSATGSPTAPSPQHLPAASRSGLVDTPAASATARLPASASEADGTTRPNRPYSPTGGWLFPRPLAR